MKLTLHCLPALCLLSTVLCASDFKQMAKVHGTGLAAGDAFGLATDTDGEVTVIGATGGGLPSNTAPGKAYVFSGCGSLSEEQVLAASDGTPDDDFGFEVAVDGDRILVGAPEAETAGIGRTGAAYVFRFDGVQWVEEQRLAPSDPQDTARFGAAVDIEGNLAVVGAPDFFVGGSNPATIGKVYSYRFDGSQWVEQEPLQYSNIWSDHFGFSVSIDAGRVAVGALHFTALPTLLSGAAFIYEPSGSGWIYASGPLRPADYATGDLIGASVALCGDTLLVGSPGDEDVSGGDLRGSCIVFRRESGSWKEQEKLVPASAVAGDQIGWWVDLDGYTSAISAHLDGSAATGGGATYVYRFDGQAWQPGEKLISSVATDGEALGAPALGGGLLVVGATGADSVAELAGSAYVFQSPVQNYGAGLAGAGGFTPALDASGVPVPGNTFTLSFRDFRGGAASCYAVGVGADPMPIAGGTFIVDMDQPFTFVTIELPGTSGAAGAGDLDLLVPIPGEASLGCRNLYLQGFAMDDAAPAGISMTNGLNLFFGKPGSGS